MANRSKNLLPTLLHRRASGMARFTSVNPRNIPQLEQELKHLENLLTKYKLNFPYFFKIDAWRAFQEEVSFDLWILERLGWGKWKNKYRLLYVMEGIPVPHLEDAEVVSVNSASSPYLVGAKDLAWSEEIHPEEVQASPIFELPNSIKEKAYPFLADFLESLAETIEQMETHNQEFDRFLESKIDEYFERIGSDRTKRRSTAIEKYFRQDRRVELFFEFLEEKEIF